MIFTELLPPGLVGISIPHTRAIPWFSVFSLGFITARPVFRGSEKSWLLGSTSPVVGGA